jgi:hypothetical protein
MNIYYLKKFRKEAYKIYGICWFKNAAGEDIWNVGRRDQLKPSYNCNASHYYDYKYALGRLYAMRRVYILSKVEEIEYKKKLPNVNKQLAKL